MRHTMILLITLCLILFQPVYAKERLLSLGGMVLLGGSTLYASSVLLVCYRLLRDESDESREP
jgi:hypothetical protein